MLELDADDLGFATYLHASVLGRFGKAHGHPVGISDAVAGAERRGMHPLDIEAGCEGGRLIRIEPVNVDAQPPLQVDVVTECAHAFRRGQEEEISVLVEIDRVTNFFLEPLEHPNGFDRQADVGFVRELMTNAAGILARRPGTEERLALDEHDVRHATPREMECHACAHAPAADDDNVGSLVHGRRVAFSESAVAPPFTRTSLFARPTPGVAMNRTP